MPRGPDLVRLPAREVTRMVAERDYVRFETNDRSYLLRATLHGVERHLCPIGFVRVHRSVIVARDDVAGLRHMGGGAWSVLHRSGALSPIGRTYLAAIRDTLGIPGHARPGGSTAEPGDHGAGNQAP